MEHLIGYIILGLSVVLTAAALIWKQVEWNKRKPTEFHRGVGMRYLEDAVKPWEHWKECIDAVLDVLQRHPKFGKDFEKLSGFWVEVVPYNKPLTNPSVTTGWTQTVNGVLRGAPRPLNDEEAKGRQRVVGSVKMERCFPWSRKQYIIQVVQIRSGDTPIDNRLMRGKGPTRPMDQSAFFYEAAKRHVEFVYTGSYMALGSVEPEYADLEPAFNNEYKMRNA